MPKKTMRRRLGRNSRGGREEPTQSSVKYNKELYQAKLAVKIAARKKEEALKKKKAKLAAAKEVSFSALHRQRKSRARRSSTPVSGKSLRARRGRR
tara:strand:+ start:184 stop:471 length:288 start_codon:yes stop_codon:yes gene_type:complete